MTADAARALARLYDLDLLVDPGDLDLYLALAGRAAGPIVELASGTGRLAVPLAEAGHRVTGLDIDPAMIERARTRASAAGEAVGGRLTLLERSLFAAPGELAGTFGLAILALNSILLLGGHRDQRRAVAAMAALIAPGGFVVVDAWQPVAEDLVRFDGRLSLEWLRRDPETGRDVAKLAAAWYDGATRAVTLTTLFDEAAAGEAPVRWTRSDVLHLISADELRSHAEDAGLVVEAIAGDYGMADLQPGDERAILVARKSTAGAPPGPRRRRARSAPAGLGPQQD